MKHARKDYNRIQDPALTDPSLLGEGSTPIAEDEPVMLFRAKDKLAPFVLSYYAGILEQSGCTDMARVARMHCTEMLNWQRTNGLKLPDMPKQDEGWRK